MTDNRVAESNSTDDGKAPRDGGGDDVIWTTDMFSEVLNDWIELRTLVKGDRCDPVVGTNPPKRK